MGQIDSGSKSSRLLASRRYTHNTLTTAQESFTNVLDLQASEVYTQASKIPTSGLSFSSSADIGSYYTVGSDNILKYWYRQKLTKSNVNNEVWFFLNPSGSDDGVGAQLINDNQEVNFVSPKYSVASLATSTTEDSTPGYLAVLYKSTTATSGSLTSDDIVSTNDYQFDYKTGIVQFMNANVDPSNSQYVFMTVNQYVGTTLATGVEVSGNISGSVSSTGSFGYLNVAGNIGLNEYIHHNGDIDTFIRLQPDEINIEAGGENMIYIVEGGGGDQADKVTINNALADVDFQVKGDTEANLFRTDAANDRVGIGTSTPGVTLEVVGSISGSATKTGSFGQVETQGFGITAKSIISGSFTAASSSIDTRIEGIADPIAMAIALGG